MSTPVLTFDRDRRTGEAASRSPAMARRRMVMLALVTATCAGLFGWMLRLMGHGGIAPVEIVMLVPFALTLPWLAIGVWNAVIGLALMMVGVLVFQQTLSRVLGLTLNLSDALKFVGRTLTAVSALSALGNAS